MEMVQLVSILDSVEVVPEACFLWCERLFRVAFGGFSSLKLIEEGVFHDFGVREIHIPDGIEEVS